MTGQPPVDRFDRAIRTVLRHEGGFVDHPDDPGGPTNYGISLRWLRALGDLDDNGQLDGDFDIDGDVDVEDIRMMGIERAIGFYREHWWEKFGYASLPLGVGEKVFDLAVNMGDRQAHKLLQRALRAAGELVIDDGILGPKTRDALRRASDEVVLAALRSEAAGFYRLLAATRPKLGAFLDGWLRRAYQ